jgi:hypothetical protein
MTAPSTNGPRSWGSTPNTGPERALQLALRNGSAKLPFGVSRAQTKTV